MGKKTKVTYLAIPTAPLHVLRHKIEEALWPRHGAHYIGLAPNVEAALKKQRIVRETVTCVVARGVTGILEGVGVYGLTYLLSPSFTAVAGAPGVALQAIGAVVGGLWLGNGKSWSGMISGSLVGGVAVGVYHLAPFIANALGVGELEGHLIAGVITILATFLIEGASGYIAYHKLEQENGKWQIEYDQSFEFPLHEKIIEGISASSGNEAGADDNGRAAAVFYATSAAFTRLNARQGNGSGEVTSVSV